MDKLFFYDTWKNKIVSVKIKRETKKMYFLVERSSVTRYLERIHKEDVDKGIAFSSPEILRTFYINKNKNEIEKLRIKIADIEDEIVFFSNVR